MNGAVPGFGGRISVNVLLLHQEEILHYRVVIYNYLSEFLKGRGIALSVLAETVQDDNPHPIEFRYLHVKPTVVNIVRMVREIRPEVIILFVNLKHLYLFPVLVFAKMNGIKTIYWGHGKDLQNPDSKIKNYLYRLEFNLVDRILLYSTSLTELINKSNRHKVTVANNTLATNRKHFSLEELLEVRDKYGIGENTLIICVGRIQKYKRIPDLIAAFAQIRNPDVGLLLVGSDDEELLGALDDRRIHYLGAVYGEELEKLLSLSNIYCMPGAIGLSIVDAFQYGLPIVTEDVQHGPEIMYLKPDVNGFIVPVGNIKALSEKLELLAGDVALREHMSERALYEINTSGSIENMCGGFLDAIRAASRQDGAC